VSQMHCLYCDRPLALLKRLTGDGEFCSKEHRKIYQQEHNHLALARLLESQPKAKEKARPDKAVKPEPETADFIKAPEVSQPRLAGFMSESLDAGHTPAPTRFAELPRFELGKPIWSAIEANSIFRERTGPGPKAAGFVAGSSGPGFVAGAARLQGKFDYKSAPGKLLLEGKGLSTAVRRPQPAGAGFVLEKSAGRLSSGTARPPAGARFSPFSPVTAGSAGAAWNVRYSKLRMAKWIAGFPPERTAPGKIRQPALETRWKALSPVLPAQAAAKIVLVLGSLLQRPVRPASQEFSPETFEIPFQPISYPPPSPRMGCLEERLHRTDRIGFSPP
jgi:hypothetical protein